MATFYAVPLNKFPAGWDSEHGMSDVRFLSEVKAHAFAHEFDSDAEENKDIFHDFWRDNEFPSVFNRWAESRGVKAADYLFIIPGSLVGMSDVWPETEDDTWASWPSLSHFAIPVHTIISRLNHLRDEQQALSDRLRQIAETDGLSL